MTKPIPNTYMKLKMLPRFLSMSNRLTRVCTRLETKPLLGRWSMLSEKDVFMRSDRSNEDHCGTCDYYIREKEKALDQMRNKKKNAFRKK